MEQEIYRVKSEVLFKTNTDGTIAIIKLDDDEDYYVIEGEATQLWNQMDGKKSVQEICESVSQSRKIPYARLAADGKNFFEQLSSEGLIENVNP